MHSFIHSKKSLRSDTFPVLAQIILKGALGRSRDGQGMLLCDEGFTPRLEEEQECARHREATAVVLHEPCVKTRGGERALQI